VQLSRLLDPEISYYYWNMEDPVLGGFSKEKIALRRAIAMAHNIDEEIRIIWNGEAKRLTIRFRPASSATTARQAAAAIRSRAGQQAAGQIRLQEGRRWLAHPAGRQAAADRYASRNEANGVLQAEMWRKTYNSLGIRMENDRMIFSDIPEGGKAVQDADAHGAVAGRLSGRRQLHAAVLRPEYRTRTTMAATRTRV
jgi:hypothetical protein